MELPIDPVVGTFGNAPAGGPTNLANRLGGNYDVPAVKTGSKLYLPIEVRGALFSLGDVHARQGDGEVVGAPEIGARVTIRLSLLDGPHSESVMIEDAIHWHTPCPGETEAEAARLAVFRNADFISRLHNITLKDALILLTMVGRLSISRTGEWATHHQIVCSSFAKETVRQAVANYHGDNRGT
jgi:amidase